MAAQVPTWAGGLPRWAGGACVTDTEMTSIGAGGKTVYRYRPICPASPALTTIILRPRVVLDKRLGTMEDWQMQALYFWTL